MKLTGEQTHKLGLGSLIANFQSLEFALRAFLINDEIASGGSRAQSATDLHVMNEGDIVPENALTNYDSLLKLIKRYNRHPKILSARLTIDETLVNTRDALAHARISSDNPSLYPLKLLKFSKPKNKEVKVTFCVLMTKKWFDEQILRVRDAIVRVAEANERLQSCRL